MLSRNADPELSGKTAQRKNRLAVVNTEHLDTELAVRGCPVGGQYQVGPGRKDKPGSLPRTGIVGAVEQLAKLRQPVDVLQKGG